MSVFTSFIDITFDDGQYEKRSMELVVDFILVAGILLNLLAIIGLLRVKERQLPQHILIVFWGFILGILTYFYANWHDLKALAFITNYVEDGARFMIPPLVYLYVKSLLVPQHKGFLREHLVHFVPFSIYWAVYTVPKSLSTSFDYIALIDNYVDWALVQDLFGIGYFLGALQVFYHVRGEIKHAYSSISKKNFLWLEHFLLSFLSVLCIDLVITISEISFGYNVNWDGYITVFFLIVAMSYLGHYGLNQPIVFLPTVVLESNGLAVVPTKSRSSVYLGEPEKSVLRQKYYHCMQEEKLFLLPDLKLTTLASAMGTSPRKLSALLNEVLATNFHDAINSYRVEEAKARLQSDLIESHSITGIGLSCGFSSKSSFYRIFKKHTSYSPSAYLEMVQKQSHSKQ